MKRKFRFCIRKIYPEKNLYIKYLFIIVIAKIHIYIIYVIYIKYYNFVL